MWNGGIQSYVLLPLPVALGYVPVMLLVSTWRSMRDGVLVSILVAIHANYDMPLIDSRGAPASSRPALTVRERGPNFFQKPQNLVEVRHEI